MIKKNPEDFPHVRELDEPGELTIVLQGGLSEGNAVETANHCRHWRHLFPAAEIILSLSGTSLLDGWLHNGILRDPKVTSKMAHDSAMQAALTIIRANCDLIVLSTDATPLPPIKSDSPKLNNINLQISAAKNGLAHATGHYVLRVRSDLIFLDRTFINHYFVGSVLPRGDAAVLSSRVLISWLYTLNPYTIERLPLHLSDWFHFGPLEDVRKLWDIPHVELQDAIHYMAHPFAEHSNMAERMFNIRLADEQFIAFNALRKLIPDLKLEYHNDHSGLTRCMDAFLDNFTLCDLVSAKCIFGKYSFDFGRHEKKLHCITPDLWRKLVDNRQIDYRSTLSDAIAEAHHPQSFEQTQGFPRIYDATRLGTKSGRYINGLIVADHDGVMSFGPHVTLPRGHYVAHVDGSVIQGDGSVTLRATLQHGAIQLASRTIPCLRDTVPEEFRLPFEITTEFGRDFEIVCETKGIRQAVLRRIAITRSQASIEPMPKQRTFEAENLLLENGILSEGLVVNAARSDGLARSPRFRLPAGAYLATVEAERISANGEIIIQVLGDWSQKVMAERVFPFTTSRFMLQVGFVIDSDEGREVEIFCGIRNLASIAVRRITVEPDLRRHPGSRNGARKLVELMRQLQQ